MPAPDPADTPAHITLVAHMFDLAGLDRVAHHLRTPTTTGQRILRDRAYLYLWGLPIAWSIAGGLGLVSAARAPGSSGLGLVVILLLTLGFLVTAASAVLAFVLEEWRLLALWTGGIAVLLAPIPQRGLFAAGWGVAAATLTMWWFAGGRRRGTP